MTDLTAALLCVALIGVNALFVAAEFALVGSPKSAIAARAARGDALAARLAALLDAPRAQVRYVATSQLGVTIASLALGMYGEHFVAARVAPDLGRFAFEIPALASIIAVAVLTFVHITFGEMVPKTLALQGAERAARLAYWPMRVMLIVLYPLAATAAWLADSMLAVFHLHAPEEATGQFHTAEELELIVEESEQGGALRAEAGRLLRELFDFGDLTAGQAMVPRVRVIGIPLGAGPADVRAVLRRRRHTRYPLYDGDLDHIVGGLHVRDLFRRLLQNEAVTREDARPLPVVPETAPLDDVLTTLQRARAELAIVVDEHGGTAGVISIEDLVEEVVGEIDEVQADAAKLTRLSDGAVRAAGTVRLDELGQYFDVPLAHDEVDSVSGLVLARLGRPPVVGDAVDYGRIRLEVTATSGRGVREVRATLLPE